MSEPQGRTYVKVHVTYHYEQGPALIEEDLLVCAVDMTRDQATRLAQQLDATIERAQAT